MISYVWAITTRQPTRLILTLLGVALCVLLMLFLLGAYRGVADGSLDYIEKSKADLWVLHKNTNNILRGQSILPSSCGETIATLPGVVSVSPILLLLSKIEIHNGWSSVYLVGYDPDAKSGGPPEIVRGHCIESDDQIVIDRAFAEKWGFNVGDSLRIQDTELHVVGISNGTNAFVIQYAFVSLARAHNLMGLNQVVSCYLVQSDYHGSLDGLRQSVESTIPDIAVYTQKEFLDNNAREMRVGFLPFIIIIVAIGSVVLATLLSLLQSISILEARTDFATVKIMGAPGGFLPKLIAYQALLIAAGGAFFGTLLVFPMKACVDACTPEVAIRLSLSQCLVVCVGVGLVSVVSAIFPMRRLKGIYPLEAFR